MFIVIEVWGIRVFKGDAITLSRHLGDSFMPTGMLSLRNPGRANHSTYHVICSWVSFGQCTRQIGTDQASAEPGVGVAVGRWDTKHRTVLCLPIYA